MNANPLEVPTAEPPALSHIERCVSGNGSVIHLTPMRYEPGAFASRKRITHLCFAFQALRLNWPAIIMAGMLAGLIAGCATVPEVTPVAREQALRFKPPPGDAGVYIICPKYFLGGQAYWDFCLDGQKPTVLKTASFSYTPVWPGEHAFSSADGGNGVTFFANEGQNYFIAVGPSMSGNYLRLISPEAGEKDVRRYEMSGDNFYKFPFMPEAVDSATPAACHIVLPQDDPFVVPAMNEMGSAGAQVAGDIHPGAKPSEVAEQAGADLSATVVVDLIGAIIDNAVNRSEAAKANRMSQTLHGYGIGESFRTNFQSSLAQAVAKSPWFRAGSSDLTREYTNGPTFGINDHPVLQINLTYGLTPCASSLFMRAEVLYFREGATNAIYHGHYSYLSEDLPVEDKKAIAKWTASDATLLRQRMGEGTSELIKMIDIDFFRRERMGSDDRTVLISAIDPFEGRPDTIRGFVLRHEGGRLIFQNRTGDLFSVIGRVTP